jgi:hypothetical protein
MAQAQSGRRVAKRAAGSTAAPTPEAEPKPTPAIAKAEKSKLSLYVCSTEHDPFTNIPLYLADTIRNIFIQRVGQSSTINVIGGRELNRSEAVKRAKAEENTYVVLLQLEDNSFDSRRTSTGSLDTSKLIIRYFIFAPLTGKVKAEGVVYQQQYRAGRGGVGLPSPTQNNPIYSDYLLKEAARQAADRVLETFRGVQPPRDPGLTVR